MLKHADVTRRTLVIADGAAFGSQIGRVYHLMMERKGIGLYLPESFEWLILCADILRDREAQAILEAPYDHIDALDYFSWERYFTALLTEKSSDTWMRYTKTRLNPVYLQPTCRDQILAVLPKAVRDAIVGSRGVSSSS